MESFLGIDVSKGYSDFVLIDSSFNELEKPFKLYDTPAGHAALEKRLSDYITKHGLSVVNCGVESTGGLEDHWFSCICKLSDKLPVRVSRLNPSVVKKAAGAAKKYQVTDPLSAKNIASYLVRYADQVNYHAPDNMYREYRSLHNHISLCTRQNTQQINSLKHMLYKCSPELQRFCKKKVPNWVLDLLTEYPTSKKLALAKAEKVARINFITLSKAHDLIAKAKISVSTRGEETDALVIQSIVQEIKSKQASIKRLKSVLVEKCKGIEVDIVGSIKGVGIDSAAAIMIEIEDIERFATPGQLVSYFGLDPINKESGDKKSITHISKAGRPAMRATLYMCANSAVLYDPHLKAIYARHRAMGKNHKQALVVIMHKLLRIIWGMLKSGKKYDNQIDRANQIKNEQKMKSIEDVGLEAQKLYEEFDQDAPISNRANRKIKAHLKSQSGSSENVRDQKDVLQVQT